VAVLKPRERLVYFRVSEDEFRQFVGVCEQAGARSVSDLARNAVQRLIADGQRHREDQNIDEKIQVLERLIAAVTEQLQLLRLKENGAKPLEFAGAVDAPGFFPVPKPAEQNGQGEE
jgi:hypothetical protein